MCMASCAGLFVGSWSRAQALACLVLKTRELDDSFRWEVQSAVRSPRVSTLLTTLSLSSGLGRPGLTLQDPQKEKAGLVASTSALGMWRQEVPWGLVPSQLSLTSKLQVLAGGTSKTKQNKKRPNQ